MTTITAKELRLRLDEIIARSIKGEVFKVTYRSKPAIIVAVDPARSQHIVPGTKEAVAQALVLADKIAIQSDDGRTLHEMYHEMLDKDSRYVANQ